MDFLVISAARDRSAAGSGARRLGARSFVAAFRFAVLVFALAIAGCAGASSARLKTENLFRDAGLGSSQTVSDYDALVFKSGGSEIYGQILKPQGMPDGRRPCVLMFHGFAGFGRFDDVGQALCRAGCVVLIPHHRGAWGSGGDYTVSHCVGDAVNLIRHVRSPEFQAKYGIDPEAVFLVGHSMGGNTVLNSATEIPGVRGIVMLAPCDIGTMVRRMPKNEMRKFLVENGLEVLRTGGFEAVYRDLVGHAGRYAFPNAATKLRGVALLLITGERDRCISNELLEDFYRVARANVTLPICARRSYPVEHGLMGARTRISCDIAEFILETLER